MNKALGPDLMQIYLPPHRPAAIAALKLWQSVPDRTPVTLSAYLVHLPYQLALAGSVADAPKACTHFSCRGKHTRCRS